MTEHMPTRPPGERNWDADAPRPPLFGLFVVDGRKSTTEIVDRDRGVGAAFDAGQVDFELWLPSGETVHGSFLTEKPLGHRAAYGALLNAAELDPAHPSFWGSALEASDPPFLDVSAWRGDAEDELRDSWVRLDERVSSDTARTLLVASAERPSYLEVDSDRGTAFLQSPGAMAPKHPARWIRVHLMPFRTRHNQGYAYGVYPLVEDWFDVCVFHAYLASRSRKVAQALGRRICDRVLTERTILLPEALAAVQHQLEFGGLTPEQLDKVRERLDDESARVREDQVPDIAILNLCLDVQTKRRDLTSADARATIARALRFDGNPTLHFASTARTATKLASYLIADLAADDPVVREWRILIERLRFLLADTATFQYEASRPGVPLEAVTSEARSAAGAKKKSGRAHLGRWLAR